jgi:hypothetical protein
MLKNTRPIPISLIILVSYQIVINMSMATPQQLATINQFQAQNAQKVADNRSFLSRLLGGKQIHIQGAGMGPTPSPSPMPLPVKTPMGTPVPSANIFNIPQDQLNKVIATVISEAGGESPQGRQAVLNSIVNRANLNPKYYGSNLFGVVSKPSQYTGFNAKDPNYRETRDYLDGKSKKLTPGRLQQIQEVQNLLQLAKQGKLQDLTSGATHYLNPKKATDFSWVKKALKKATVGQHEFYYLKS